MSRMNRHRCMSRSKVKAARRKPIKIISSITSVGTTKVHRCRKDTIGSQIQRDVTKWQHPDAAAVVLEWGPNTSVSRQRFGSALIQIHGRTFIANATKEMMARKAFWSRCTARRKWTLCSAQHAPMIVTESVRATGTVHYATNRCARRAIRRRFISRKKGQRSSKSARCIEVLIQKR